MDDLLLEISKIKYLLIKKLLMSRFKINFRHILPSATKFLVYGLLFQLGIIVFISFPHEMRAQGRCGTAEYVKLLRSKFTNMETSEQFENWVKQKLSVRRSETFNNDLPNADSYKVAVVVHIIHNGEPIGVGSNLSDEQILNQLTVLNNDYNRLNADTINTPPEFKKFAGRMNIQFIPAKIDPNGLPTSGITRTNGRKKIWSINDDDEIKSIENWSADNYLNIWVCKLGGDISGFSSIPETNLVKGFDDFPFYIKQRKDGLVISYDVFGNGTPNLLKPYDLGRTLTHELGHYFGLIHIWGDGNDDGSQCESDFVDDTPTQATSTLGKCPSPSKPLFSCGNENMTQNYMDYTNDACMNIFTTGQVERMKIILNNSPRRASLLTSPAVQAYLKPIDVALLKSISPGIVQCKTNPIIKFAVKNSDALNLISFKIVYSVNGGENQVKDFSNIGFARSAINLFSIGGISLRDGENIITLTLIKPNFFDDLNPADNTITFTTIVDKSTEIVPFRMTFDNANSEKSWLSSRHNSSDDWELAVTNKNNSTVFNAFSTKTTDISNAWLVSPIINLSEYDHYTMIFDVSYAQNISVADSLKLVASVDCGVTFNKILWSKSGSEFKIKDSSSEWFPKTDSEWKREFVNLSSLARNDSVRLALLAINQNGNNIFVDNIELFIGDSMPPPITSSDYQLYYPSKENLSKIGITFNFEERKTVRLQIFSILGQGIINNNLPDILNQTMYYDFSNLSSGVYFLKLMIGDKSHVTKFFIIN